MIRISRDGNDSPIGSVETLSSLAGFGAAGPVNGVHSDAVVRLLQIDKKTFGIRVFHQITLNYFPGSISNSVRTQPPAGTFFHSRISNQKIVSLKQV
ncbi:hypothetical protein Ciccas_013921 [Cichlidogyrus casuarinus]|uniref:Uncharacterized protein n=1 Tax=Cichlidogyrus casuarinus TaxID=1844966 RepID=A0ABD2PJB7_9PLAT